MNYDILLFFRIMLYKISEDLSTEDLQRLIFYSGRVFKLTRKEKQSLSSAFDLFVLLEKRGHLTVLNTKCLKDMIKTLENRGDLMDLVTSYQGKFKGVTCSSLPFQDLSPGFQQEYHDWCFSWSWNCLSFQSTCVHHLFC
jgi:hypothetical protein